MKYLLDLHLKTKTKRVGTYNSFEEAKASIVEKGLTFKEINYYGGNPVFKDAGGKVYSLTGGILTNVGTFIHCSILDVEAKYFKEEVAAPLEPIRSGIEN
jgi:hypothetical protein